MSRIWGKLLGGVVGWLVGGPWGAAAGMGLGHLIDSSAGKVGSELPKIRDIDVEVGVFPEIFRNLPIIKATIHVVAPESVPFGVVMFFQQGDEPVRSFSSSYAGPEGIAMVYMDSSNARFYHNLYTFNLWIPVAVLDIPTPGHPLKVVAASLAGGQVVDEGAVEIALDATKNLEEFLPILNVLWGAVLADSRIDRTEVRKIKEILTKEFGFSLEDLKGVKDYLKSLDLTRSQALDAARVVAGMFDMQGRLRLMTLILAIVAADGVLDPQEVKYVSEVAVIFGIDRSTLEDLYRQDSLLGRLRALMVLGLGPTATKEEIRERYRELVKKYHPDRLVNLDEEFRRLGEQKFKEITSAYEYLMGKG